MIRAWPGGFGNAKVGANYGPSILAQAEAVQRGYHQVLWLFGEQGYVTEAGASNFFVLWKTKDTGVLEMVTPPLEQGIILEGITRASVIELAREKLTHVAVRERKFTIHDMIEANDEGRLLEAFAVGTAYFIAACSEIRYGDAEILLPLGQAGADVAKCRKYSSLLKDSLKGIMFGNAVSAWAVEVETAS